MNNKIKTLSDKFNTKNVTFKTLKTNWNGFFNSEMCKLQTEFVPYADYRPENGIGVSSIVIFYLANIDKTILSIEDYKADDKKPKLKNMQGNHTQQLYRIIKDNSTRKLVIIAKLLTEYMNQVI